jgi:acyl-coenzyme A synthetase/AMP-(fatty) acid ligase
MQHSLVTDLSRYSDNVALIEQGQATDYASLAREAERFADRFGSKRALVFLEAHNTVCSIAAYLGCLIGQHPVYLFAEQDRDKISDLIGRYKPNFVVTCRDGICDLVQTNPDPLELHPDLCVLLSTSGSTGSPKLVKLSRQNIESNADAIAKYLALGPTEKALTGLRFNYSYGMSVLNSHLRCGGALVLTDRSAADKEFWELLADSGGTSFAGVPYTFERLRRASFPWAEMPTLRYATQAGGKLSADLVRHFAGLGERHGWRFYVMYGQTEASPRMAYLPPEHAAAFPDCVGVPIPGGEINLLDESGNHVLGFNQPGELAFSGPNVMMGYARGAADLATDETPAELLTGDIGCRHENGLFYIVGRKSRFIKPFGIRLNLDDVQSQVRRWAPTAVCAGTDDRVAIAIVGSEMLEDAERIIPALTTLYNLPAFVFSISVVDEIPLLGTGKIDYQRLLDLPLAPSLHAPSRIVPGPRSPIADPSAWAFFRRVAFEVTKIIGFATEEWESVTHIYETILGVSVRDRNSTFSSLSGDSLSYVQVHLALETHLGTVPDNWEHMTLHDLERMKSDAMAL